MWVYVISMHIDALQLSFRAHTAAGLLKFCSFTSTNRNSKNFCDLFLVLIGKTTALNVALSLLGANGCQLFSKITKQKILQLCCQGTLPVVVDDPESQNDINRLIIDLYNGAKSGTISRGEAKPQSGAIIAANFTIPAIQR